MSIRVNGSAGPDWGQVETQQSANQISNTAAGSEVKKVAGADSTDDPASETVGETSGGATETRSLRAMPTSSLHSQVMKAMLAGVLPSNPVLVRDAPSLPPSSLPLEGARKLPDPIDSQGPLPSADVGALEGVTASGAPFSAVGSAPLSSYASPQEFAAAATAAAVLSNDSIDNDPLGQALPGVITWPSAVGQAVTYGAAKYVVTEVVGTLVGEAALGVSEGSGNRSNSDPGQAPDAGPDATRAAEPEWPAGTDPGDQERAEEANRTGGDYPDKAPDPDKLFTPDPGYTDPADPGYYTSPTDTGVADPPPGVGDPTGTGDIDDPTGTGNIDDPTDPGNSNDPTDLGSNDPTDPGNAPNAPDPGNNAPNAPDPGNNAPNAPDPGNNAPNAPDPGNNAPDAPDPGSNAPDPGSSGGEDQLSPTDTSGAGSTSPTPDFTNPTDTAGTGSTSPAPDITNPTDLGYSTDQLSPTDTGTADPSTGPTDPTDSGSSPASGSNPDSGNDLGSVETAGGPGGGGTGGPTHVRA